MIIRGIDAGTRALVIPSEDPDACVRVSVSTSQGPRTVYLDRDGAERMQRAIADALGHAGGAEAQATDAFVRTVQDATERAGVRQIASLLQGVSDTMVRRWCKGQSLPGTASRATVRAALAKDPE